MSKKRVLFVTQEMNPYTDLSEISKILRALAPYTQTKGMEIRVLMPKYGTINERRHRLHEVVRLSGMNIIVDDDDFPLILKVASLPGARMQVYFLDNEEFFSRKQIFTDDKGKSFKDNQQRMVFFCKGVIETVKKFGWPPDIIHCHGWLTSLVPFYLKNVYKNEPIFEKSSVLYSAYNDSDEASFTKKFLEIAAINDLDKSDLDSFLVDDKIRLHMGGIKSADAVVIGEEKLSPDYAKAIKALKDKPVLNYSELEALPADALAFYKSIIEAKEEEA